MKQSQRKFWTLATILLTIHSKKKLVDLTEIWLCVLSHARLPVLKGVAQILRVYYMLE